MEYIYPHFLKRLIALIYDLFLLFAVLFFAAIPPVLIFENPADHILFRVYLFLIIFLFYGWFWTHGGQTLGMRAWRLKVINNDGNALSWGQALIRFLAAILSWGLLGLGFIWALFDRRRQTLHDYLSGTKLIQLPRR